jgi:predicted ribosome quality control (RQC) complex YloA/Tae2 family protein
MHFHYFALERLVEVLSQSLTGKRIEAAFSQSKNELVLQAGDSFLRIGCSTPLTYIVPVEAYAKAKKNVVDLLPRLLGRVIRAFRLVAFDRVVVVELDGGMNLVLKMHGIRANVMLRKKGKVIDMFRKDIAADKEFVEQKGFWNADAIAGLAEAANSERELLGALRLVSPVFDRWFAAAIKQQMDEGKSAREAFDEVLAQAKTDDWYISKGADKVKFWLFFPPDKEAVVVKVRGISEALYFFFRNHFVFDTYRKQFMTLRKEIEKPYEKYSGISESYRESIRVLETDRNPEEIGHLLMANLHLLEERQTSVELFDFYQNEPITIKLQENLGPVENAERYYAKHKTRKARLKFLRSESEVVARKLAIATEKMEEFRKLLPPENLHFSEAGFRLEEVRALRSFLREEEAEETGPQSPYREYERNGYRIFVGRNGKNNDLLTFKFASKDDLWLHARDVSGSHVIIRQKAGQGFPEPVVEYAAGLAAWFSKRKHGTLVPVIYTPRKYVRKRKGDPPGKVVVGREKVILVEPEKG